MRSARVATPEIAVQLGSASGWLVNISATGALVRTKDVPALGATCPLTLNTHDSGVTLSVRIVRVEPGAPHLVGLVFTDCSSGARQAIARLCGAVF